MAVRVIFSDGSKQLAHNTNDLRERWELRQQIAQEEISEESKRGYSVPYPSDDADLQELHSIKGEYVTMRLALAARNKQLYPVKMFRREIAHVAFLLTEVEAAQRDIKARIKNWHEKKRLEEVERERSLLWHYSQELEQIIADMGGVLPSEPYDHYRTPTEVAAAKE